jgi:hypothetical protein
MSDVADAQGYADPEQPRIPHEGRPIEHCFDGLYAQAIVRDQPVSEVNAMIDRLKELYNQFDKRSLTKDQFKEAMQQYVANDLEKGPGDIDTIIAVKDVVIRLNHEADLR